MMARKRKKPVEDEPRHAAWAIPYGDLVTLLFAFFVVLYAVSSVNEGKYRALSSTLFTEFNGQKPPGSAAGSAPGSVAAARPEPSPAARTATADSHQIFADTATVTRQQAQEIARSQAQSQALDKVASDVSAAMSDLIKDNLVVVRRNGTTVEVEIHSDILFPSGSATLSPTAVSVIRKLSQTLAALPNPVRVEGHTDSQPIDTLAFPSNWETLLRARRQCGAPHCQQWHQSRATLSDWACAIQSRAVQCLGCGPQRQSPRADRNSAAGNPDPGAAPGEPVQPVQPDPAPPAAAPPIQASAG